MEVISLGFGETLRHGELQASYLLEVSGRRVDRGSWTSYFSIANGETIPSSTLRRYRGLIGKDSAHTALPQADL